MSAAAADPPSPGRRRQRVDAAVKDCFEASGGTYGSPRVRAQLRRDGHTVSKKTVEASMARQGLQARTRPRRRGLTRPDKSADPVPDLLRRDFTAEAPDQKWVGDFKQIPTDQGPVFLATVEDLYSRRMLGFATSERDPTAGLAAAALNMAAATRGGSVAGVIFHTDKGAQYSSGDFAEACRRLGVNQSMGRVGCALDNAAAESFFSTLQHELISRRRWQTRDHARRDIAAWIDTWYNPLRLHSANNMTSPLDHEQAQARTSPSRLTNTPRFGGKLTPVVAQGRSGSWEPGSGGAAVR